jgi:hypothetical protein
MKKHYLRNRNTSNDLLRDYVNPDYVSTERRDRAVSTRASYSEAPGSILGRGAIYPGSTGWTRFFHFALMEVMAMAEDNHRLIK